MVSAPSGVPASGSLAWLGRNEDGLKRHPCLSIYHATDMKDSNKMGIAPGILCWEKERCQLEGELAFRKETPHSSNTLEDETEV